MLIEHKSSPDPLVALQLHRYMGRIWEKLHRDEATQPFANILPLAVYHGPRKWTVPTDFKSVLADVPGVMQPYQVDFEYLLVDLNEIADDEMSKDPRLASFLLALKYGRHSDTEKHLVIILSPMDRLSQVDFFKLMTYILEVSTAACHRSRLWRC